MEKFCEGRVWSGVGMSGWNDHTGNMMYLGGDWSRHSCLRQMDLSNDGVSDCITKLVCVSTGA